MNSELYDIYNIKAVNSATTTNYELEWTIYDIKWLLSNQTNREIRTERIAPIDSLVCDGANKCGCFELKLQFVGEENETIKIYYKRIHRDGNINCRLTINQCVPINLQYNIIPKNEWKLITAQSKNTILGSGYTNMTLFFTFVVQCSSNQTTKIIEPQGPQEEFFVSYENINRINPNYGVVSNVAYLLMNDSFSDVTIKSIDGEKFPAHKCFLAFRSPVFKASFEYNSGEGVLTNSNSQPKRIKQKNKQFGHMKLILESPFDAEVLENVLHYVYTDKAPKIYKIPQKLLIAADFYQLNGLKNLCEKMIAQKLTVENAIEMLELANLYSATYLKRKTLEFISDGLAGEITLTKGWKNLQSPELIKSIYEFVLVK